MKRNMRSGLGLLLAPVGLMVAFLLVQGCKGTGNAPPTEEPVVTLRSREPVGTATADLATAHLAAAQWVATRPAEPAAVEPAPRAAPRPARAAPRPARAAP